MLKPDSDLAGSHYQSQWRLYRSRCRKTQNDICHNLTAPTPRYTNIPFLLTQYSTNPHINSKNLFRVLFRRRGNGERLLWSYGGQLMVFCDAIRGSRPYSAPAHIS